MQTINERLAMLPDLLGYDSPAALAKAMGLDPNTVRKAMQGPSKPSFDTIEAITKKHPKLNPDWLLLGNGEPLRDGRALSQLPTPLPPAVREGFPEVPGTATPEQANFVGKYIKRLEEDLLNKDALIEWLQEQNATLLGKSPASPEAAGALLLAFPRQEVAGFRPSACITARKEGKVVEMWKGWKTVRLEPVEKAA